MRQNRRVKRLLLLTITIWVWFTSVALMCLGGFLVITSPLSRLGLGEPGTGMSWEEFKRINAEIAASPWTPVPFVIAGLFLLIVPVGVMIAWTVLVSEILRRASGPPGAVPPILSDQIAVPNGSPAEPLNPSGECTDCQR
jgi:hypothetical protein